MHPFIAAISLCSIVLLFLAAAAAAVSAQPQAQPLTPTTPSNNNVGPHRGGHHGPHHGHHRVHRGWHHRGGHHRARNQNGTASPTPTPNQNQNQNQEPLVTKLDGNPAQNPKPNPPPPNQIQNQKFTTPPSQGNENNVNPGKLFGYVPKNDTVCDSKTQSMDEFLHAHNWVRSKYNLPPFTWDAKLESFARSYLMERYNDCKMVHSGSDYGENMFWGQKLHWTPSDAVYYWYDEKNWYDFNTLKCLPNKACGHFTQMVWRDSVRIGCALQHCNDRNAGMLIACEYDPPGNYDNENPLEQHNQTR